MNARKLCIIAAALSFVSTGAVHGDSTELCDVARRLDAAASSDFQAGRGEVIHSESDFRAFRLQPAYLLPVVSRRSDCELQIEGRSPTLAIIECRVVIGGADHATTVRRSRELADALVACLNPTRRNLGQSTHVFDTAATHWSIVVPRGESAMQLNVRARRL